MVVCWKYLVQSAFVNLFGTALGMIMLKAVPALGLALRILMVSVGAAIVIAFFRRVRFQNRRARMEPYYSPVI